MTLTVDLTGRVALVTGGSQGIGAGIAAVLVEAGARVVTCARSSLADPPDGTRHVVCDVRDADAVAALVDDVVATEGRLDVLVNNAGGSPYAEVADSSNRLLDGVLGLNLTAPLIVAREAHRVMGTHGAIVNVSSVSATRPSPGTAAYGAAKAGLDSLTRSLAVEWGPRIRVNAVDVGLCRTDDTTAHYGGEGGIAAIEATIPLGRMATATEVGRVVAFLASDLASYVSGATVAVHGGGEPPVFLHVLKEQQ